MPYGIVLLPDKPLVERFVAFSNDVASPSAIMSLDPRERPPHVTLLHVDADEEVATRWWNKVKTEVETSIPVSLSGLMFAPIAPGNYYVPEGGVYFGLEATNTAVLRGAHHRILQAASELAARPIGVIGDGFAPHITLGILKAFPKHVDLSSEVLGTSFEGHLAFGRLGNYGTFPEILERMS
jgi:2'-5' RNA ligase